MSVQGYAMYRILEYGWLEAPIPCDDDTSRLQYRSLVRPLPFEPTRNTFEELVNRLGHIVIGCVSVASCCAPLMARGFMKCLIASPIGERARLQGAPRVYRPEPDSIAYFRSTLRAQPMDAPPEMHAVDQQMLHIPYTIKVHQCEKMEPAKLFRFLKCSRRLHQQQETPDALADAYWCINLDESENEAVTKAVNDNAPKKTLLTEGRTRLDMTTC